MNASSFAHMILKGLQPNSRANKHDKHVYGGTVDYNTVQNRRRKNKVARRSRAANRK